MNLANALAGPAKLEGIQWLLLSAVPHRALRRKLRALLSAPATLGQCRLRRARFKPGHKLTAYYDALVHSGGTEGYCARPVAVTWGSDGDADWRQGGGDLAEMQAEALRQGVAAPFRQLVTDVPEWSMQIQVSPLDPRFPQLVRLSDPRHVRNILATTYAASDPASDQLRPGGYAVSSIRYHPGKRHVLRYDPLQGGKGRTVFAKPYIGEEAARVFRVATQAGDWLAEHGGGATAVRPLAHVAEDAAVIYPRVFGTPLCAQLRRPGLGLALYLERAGAALHALHQLPQAVAGPLQPHDFTGEVSEITREACDHIPVLLPSVGAVMDAILDRARELHERLPEESPTFTHGDFKCEHVWAAPVEVTLIDFDSSCLADPAFDLGKFLADLQLWHATYDQPGLEQAQERFLAGYGPGAREGRLLRARLYEAVQLVKIARRVPLFDLDWASRTKWLIRRAQAALNALELTLGLRATQPSLPGFLDGLQKRRHTGVEPRRLPSWKGARC